MSLNLIKIIKDTGVTINKDKLIDTLRKSPDKEFSMTYSPDNKNVMVLVRLR